MNYPHQYPTPPPRWNANPQDFMGAGAGPHPGPYPPPNYYSPRYTPATPSPRDSPKVHAHHRRASHAVPSAHPPQYSYNSPRGGTPQYESFSPRYGAQQQSRMPDFVPVFADAKPKPTTTQNTANTANRRRASHSAGSKHMNDEKKKPATPKASHPKATEEDARRAGIPAGYSYKNWDPTEEPIVLLGSVFDANSLGKWIYDWAVHHSEPASPISEMAGELWLLLIQLAGKVKRAEDTLGKIRKQESRELVEDFLESGDRLWVRFSKMLKACEEYMWRLAQKESGEKKPASLGKNSGLDFVDSMFGRDQQLEKLEKWMTGARLWGMRFDANCEDILRFPSA